MIQRTLLEWKSLPYGDGEIEIPDWAASRLVHIARQSPLGGEGGARILAHGRTSIRAGQVVGVIAAEGCTLEILPKIDFPDQAEDLEERGKIRKRLVHMLAVALDLEISAGAITDLGWQNQNMLEILIGLFADKLAQLVRQGLPRRYRAANDDLAVLKGRLDVARQFTRFVPQHDRIACGYDELSSDIALNQIMRAAVMRLLAAARSVRNQSRLRELAFAYSDVAETPVAALRWDQVVLDRTNAKWRELLRLAKLLLGNRFQTTSTGAGTGFSLLFEMNTLFEEYVARMLRRALPNSGLRVSSQGGGLYCLEDVSDGASRFMTRPDIIISEGRQARFIVDTKWKRLSARIDDPKQGVSQSDIYQMMAYGRIYACPRLALLYPHHRQLQASEGVLSEHRIVASEDKLLTATVDVSKNGGIEATLLEICERAISKG